MKSANQPKESALFWTFAVAAIAALLVAMTARVADRFLAAYHTETTSYAIARIVSPDDDAAMQRAEEALRAAPEVTRAERMSAERAAQMLRDAGSSSSAEDMPALRLIELRLAPGINGAEVTGDLSERLGAAGISGEILRPHPNQTQQALKAAPLLVHGGAIGFALVLCAIAGLAARGLASRRADLIQVLADLGATRGQAGKRIGDEAGAIGFGAGLLAAFLAAAGAFAAMLLMIPGADLSNLARHISLLDVAPLALAPFLCAFVAGSGARAAADSLYAEAARLA